MKGGVFSLLFEIETLIIQQNFSFIHVCLLLQTQGTLHVCTWYGTLMGDSDLSFRVVQWIGALSSLFPSLILLIVK